MNRRKAARAVTVGAMVLLASLLTAGVARAGVAVGALPGSAPPGTEITVFGDGFQPGEVITIFFGGVEVVTEADGEGSFTTFLVIDELMPPGMHPMEVSGDMGSYIDFEYQVDPPPETTTTQPATTTQPEATTTTQPETTTTSETSTTAEPTTTGPMTSVVEDDTRVSTTEGDSFPWWLFIIAIILAALLGAGIMMAASRRRGAFQDTSGNQWAYCAGRACKVAYKTVTKTPSEGGRQVLVSAQPRGTACAAAGCSCVLFEVLKGGGLKLVDEKGGWVPRVGGAQYSARCVRKV